MRFRKRLEEARRVQRELSGLTDEDGEENQARPKPEISAGEAFRISAFALLYFVPLCLGILLLMCFLGGLFMFF